MSADCKRLFEARVKYLFPVAAHGHSDIWSIFLQKLEKVCQGALAFSIYLFIVAYNDLLQQMKISLTRVKESCVQDFQTIRG